MATNSKPKLLICFLLNPTETAVYQQSFDVEFCGSERIATEQEIIDHIAGKDAVLCMPLTKISKRVLDAADSKLKILATISAGFEHIDLEECKKRNIPVGYLGSLVADIMAEFTIGLMITVGRRFKEALEVFPSWGTSWSSSWLNGYDIMDSVVGIVGLGFIGQAIAKRLEPFGTKKILYCGPRKKPEGEALGAEYVTFQDLLKESDFVIASCTVNDSTRKMFNREAFKQMKPTSIFINVCRGDVVDHEALNDALSSKQIWGAGLDCTTPEPFPVDHPLAKLTNCVILPHIGTASVKLRERMHSTTYLNLLAGVKGEPLPIRLV